MTTNAEEYNHDELVPPPWLNADYLKNVLCHCEKDADIKVNSFELSPGTGKGDHYASIMFRAVVHFEQLGKEKMKSMIIKIMPDADGHKKDFFAESHIFETEIGIYTEIIPKFEEILRSVGDNTKLGAICLYHSLEPRKVIIFEDLCQLGYKVVRDRQPNMEEVKLAYLKLAKFHAISYKLLKEQPDLFNKYRHGLFTMPNMVNEPYMHDGLENFIEILDLSRELHKLKPYFENMRGKLVPACQAECNEFLENPQEDGHYVLCHGDYHSKNMMYKYNEESDELMDCMLIDFQMSYVGPIGSDIIYSFYMLFNTDFRLNRREEFICYYYSYFAESLKKIGYKNKIFSLMEYKLQLLKYRHIDIFYLTTFLPLWSAFLTCTVNMEKTFLDADYRKELYKNEAFLSELKVLLPQLLSLGYLEN